MKERPYRFISTHSRRHSFFSSAGAVAGTFSVVRLFGGSRLLCLFPVARRKYRRRIGNRQLYNDKYWQSNHSALHLNGGPRWRKLPAQGQYIWWKVSIAINFPPTILFQDASISLSYTFSASEAHTQVPEYATDTIVLTFNDIPQKVGQRQTHDMICPRTLCFLVHLLRLIIGAGLLILPIQHISVIQVKQKRIQVNSGVSVFIAASPTLTHVWSH